MLWVAVYAATSTSRVAKPILSFWAGRRSATCLPASVATMAARVKGMMTDQSNCATADPGDQGGRGVGGNDEQRGADGLLHREAEDEDQGGDDHEPAADTEEAGEESDGEPGGDDAQRAG